MTDLTFELNVSQIINETSDSASFVFDVPAQLREKFDYKPGQFVTLLLNIDGESVKRSYSLCSSPDTDKEFKITVKRVKGGLVSNHLMDQLSEGDKIRMTPPAGIFSPKSLDESKHYVLFAGGSGITPIYSILKSALHRHPDTRVTLVYANRNENNIIFSKELAQLESRYGERFKVFHCFSQPIEDCEFKGRLCTEKLGRMWPSIEASKQTVEAFLCGPDGFMETAKNYLIDKGVSKDHIHQESFDVTPVSDKDGPVVEADWILIGDESQKGTPKTLEVHLNGETIKLDYDGKSTILETLIEQDKNPPYSCMDGACMACMAKVTGGLVYQEDEGILDEENISDGETLTCQAKGLSEKVVIDFDNI